jgi:hypothetical protein
MRPNIQKREVKEYKPNSMVCEDYRHINSKQKKGIRDSLSGVRLNAFPICGQSVILLTLKRLQVK